MPGWSKIGNLRGAPYAQKVMSAASTGMFSGSFAPGQFRSPIVSAVAVASGGRDYVVTMTSVTAVGYVGQVRASRTLPAVISALSVLLGYDTFAAPTSAVEVHVTASEAT